MWDLQGYGWILLQGVRLTLTVGLASMCIAIVLGLLGVWGKLSSSPIANAITQTYTTVIRGVPELVLLLLVYYGVPTLIQDTATTFGWDILININPFVAGVGTLSFIYGAFATEVFRGAYMAVPKGQIEAAYAVGLNRYQMAWLVLLPQMMRFALPGLGNVWLVLIKATALISIIQLPELMRNADIAARATHMPFTFYFAASLIYLCITALSMWGQRHLETWAARGIAVG